MGSQGISLKEASVHHIKPFTNWHALPNTQWVWWQQVACAHTENRTKPSPCTPVMWAGSTARRRPARCGATRIQQVLARTPDGMACPQRPLSPESSFCSRARRGTRGPREANSWHESCCQHGDRPTSLGHRWLRASDGRQAGSAARPVRPVGPEAPPPLAVPTQHSVTAQTRGRAAHAGFRHPHGAGVHRSSRSKTREDTGREETGRGRQSARS